MKLLKTTHKLAENYTLHEAADKRPVLQKAAAIAYDRKGDFVDAEKECLKALHYHRIQLGHGLDLNQATIANTISFLLNLNDKQDRCDALDTFVLVPTGLLYKAGFETTPGTCWSFSIVFRWHLFYFPGTEHNKGPKMLFLVCDWH